MSRKVAQREKSDMENNISNKTLQTIIAWFYENTDATAIV